MAREGKVNHTVGIQPWKVQMPYRDPTVSLWALVTSREHLSTGVSHFCRYTLGYRVDLERYLSTVCG